MEVVKTRSGWALSFGEGCPRRPARTKREAEGFMAEAVRVRGELAAHEAAAATRLAEHLASRGIGPVDFRQIGPGDLFAWGPAAPIRTVTGVKHLENGASLIFWAPGPHDEPAFALNLMGPGMQAYGLLRHETEA